MPHVHFYIPEEKKDTWKSFLKLCHREGDSASEKLTEWFCKYYDLHKHGNPQILMNHFLEQEAARIRPAYLKPHLSVGEHSIQELKAILAYDKTPEYDKFLIREWLKEIGELDD